MKLKEKLILKFHAVCEAYISPITRKPDDVTPDTKLEKIATSKTITSAHKRKPNKMMGRR